MMSTRASCDRLASNGRGADTSKPGLAERHDLQRGEVLKYMQQGLLCVFSHREPSSDSLGHHHLNELLVVDLSVTIHISLANHFINLLVRQLLAQVCHHVTQLSRRNETITVTVKDLEGFDQLLLGIGVLHLSCHQRQEFREVDGTVAISIHL